MYCIRCGSRLQDNARFCVGCGSPAQQMYPAGAPGAGAAPGAPWAPRADTLDVERSFSFLFKDKEWLTRVLLLGLIMLIPLIGGMVLMGYFIEVARNAAEGRDLPLPQIKFGDQLGTGFMYFVSMFLAVLLVLAAAGIPVGGGVLLITADYVAPGVILICMGGLIYLAGLIFFVTLLPLAIIKRDPFFIFRFAQGVDALKNNAANVLIFVLLSFVYMTIGSLGVYACYIGMIFTVPVGYIMQAHLAGQLGRLMNITVSPELKQDAGSIIVQ